MVCYITGGAQLTKLMHHPLSVQDLLQPGKITTYKREIKKKIKRSQNIQSDWQIKGTCE